ncbi:GNAT family N-acetyltransferase [Haliangium sp. UPWRP_2]|uniref:GNAT family N-acetyltransferase n=1 Tax=Haliangium sp. UPWRP_2 TaxID=1931276 RepID=UPI000B53C737|nr:GNAT family N-acetyltransferase [Haliangium sp. UPWRP_2]PSM32025.1 N-acetyltransferase [Haliangium sp. UPWRP_2]
MTPPSDLPPYRVRAALPSETGDLVNIGTSTGLFSKEEADLLLRQTLEDLHAGRLGDGHVVLVIEDPRVPGGLGWAYASLDPKSNGVWDLWWIGVMPSRHGSGLGTLLLASVEEYVKREHGRVLVIETSALPALAATRRFYERRGYMASGTVPDFYGDGDAKVTFAKTLHASTRHTGPNTNPTNVREATAADLPAIVELAMALGRQHQGYDPERFTIDAFGATPVLIERTYRDFFEEALRDANSMLYVGDRSGEVVGYVFGRVEEASFIDLSPRAGWIHDVYVRGSARGEGLGERLLDQAISALRGHGVREIMLSVSPMNGPARRLFEGRGFGVTMLECRLRTR